MTGRSSITAVIVVAALATAPMAIAGTGLVRSAQTDEAPATLQDANPSKAEPMMLGPTPEDNAANYRRDFVACESQPGDQRAACRASVDEEYQPEVTNLSSGCDSLNGEAKAECLRSNGPER